MVGSLLRMLATPMQLWKILTTPTQLWHTLDLPMIEAKIWG